MRTRLLLLAILTLLLVAALPAAKAATAGAGASAPVARSSATARPSGSTGSGNFGLGVMLGDPTGLSAKYWLGQTSALQFGLAYSWDHYANLLVDYLWHFPSAFGKGGSAFVPYVGVGGILFVSTGYTSSYDGPYWNGRFWVYAPDPRSRGDVGFGVRIPLGVEFLPRTAPLGVFAELVPGVRVVPGADAMIQGALGIRIYL